jgi:hypothetical protein
VTNSLAGQRTDMAKERTALVRENGFPPNPWNPPSFARICPVNGPPFRGEGPIGRFYAPIFRVHGRSLADQRTKMAGNRTRFSEKRTNPAEAPAPFFPICARQWPAEGPIASCFSIFQNLRRNSLARSSHPNTTLKYTYRTVKHKRACAEFHCANFDDADWGSHINRMARNLSFAIANLLSLHYFIQYFLLTEQPLPSQIIDEQKESIIFMRCRERLKRP